MWVNMAHTLACANLINFGAAEPIIHNGMSVLPHGVVVRHSVRLPHGVVLVTRIYVVLHHDELLRLCTLVAVEHSNDGRRCVHVMVVSGAAQIVVMTHGFL